MKSCPQCNTKCFNSAARCECGYSFREEPPAGASPAAIHQTVVGTAARHDSGETHPENEGYPTTSGGLVKLDPDTPLESFFTSAGAIMAVLFLTAIWMGLFGHRHIPPQPAVLPCAPFLLVAALVFFVARWCTDNYYLVDAKEHRVFYHFKFLWFRQVRLLLERRDILAVATQGYILQFSGRLQEKWAYRVLIVGVGGQRAEVTSWRRGQDGLDESNAEAAKVARLLDCQFFECPPRCEIRLRVKDRPVSVTFPPLRFGLTRSDGWILLIVALLAVAGCWFLMR